MRKVNQFKIIRKPEVIKRLGLSKSTLSNRINQGVFPRPISLGERAVGWLEHEVDIVLAAMSVGNSKTKMKALVKQLIKQRKELSGIPHHF